MQGVFAAALVTADAQVLVNLGLAHRDSEWQPGKHHPRRWQEPDGYPALPGGTGLHPPGPGDHAAWAATLASRPDLARCGL